MKKSNSNDASGFLLVALGACLWGSDAFFRRALALELPSTIVVAGEHLIITVLLFPVLWRAATAVRRLTAGQIVSLLIIGVGSSALATVLFTSAFRYGDPNTPLLLQKLQPLFAVTAASWILRERLRPRFGIYFLLALGGAYLITFPDPTNVEIAQLTPALLAVGAALLWGLGTVLGRHVAPAVSPIQLTALRVAIGLAFLAPAVVIQGQAPGIGDAVDQAGALVLLALVPGLIALVIYYNGLRSTPASAATLAELAFPLSAVVINYLAFGATLSTSQWFGLAALSATILVMGLVGRREKGAHELGIDSVALAVGNP
ncbi:MAG: DMT family transporter [Acidimicrobiia bacterium]